MPRVGLNIMNMGDIGTGKTYSIRTMASRVPTFVLATEPTTELLVGIPNLFFATVKARSLSWTWQKEYAKSVNTLSVEMLAKVQDPRRGEHNQFLELLSLLNDFVDQNGVSWGDTTTWGPDRCLAIDALTGTNKMILDLVTGSRVIRSQPEWGIAISTQERLVDTLISLNCHVILNCHLEPERDEVSGAVRNYPSAIGRKLGPQLGRNFGEVLHSRRDGPNKYFWSTVSATAATKSRLLPQSEMIVQDYGPLYDAWDAGWKEQEKEGEEPM